MKKIFLWGIAALELAGASAYGLPEYALKEGKQCVYCHYDPRGGGPTNARGRYYAEHFTLQGYVEKKKVRHKKKKAPNDTSASPDSSSQN